MCLKIHSRQVHAPLCGIFGPHSVNAAYYASLIRVKSPTNCDAHLTESNFQTRSSTTANFWWPAPSFSDIMKEKGWYYDESNHV